jgi:hypothetical protein
VVTGGEIDAIIAGASAVGGGMVVAVSNYVGNRAQARDARKQQLQRALIELYDVLQRINARLLLEPEPGKTERAVNKAMAARAPLLDDALGRIRRRLLDPQLDELSAAISKALSAATVIAPREMLPTLRRLTEAMEKADQRDEKWWTEWNAARTDYFLACRAVLGSWRARRAFPWQASPNGGG